MFDVFAGYSERLSKDKAALKDAKVVGEGVEHTFDDRMYNGGADVITVRKGPDGEMYGGPFAHFTTNIDGLPTYPSVRCVVCKEQVSLYGISTNRTCKGDIDRNWVVIREHTGDYDQDIALAELQSNPNRAFLTAIMEANRVSK